MNLTLLPTRITGTLERGAVTEAAPVAAAPVAAGWDLLLVGVALALVVMIARLARPRADAGRTPPGARAPHAGAPPLREARRCRSCDRPTRGGERCPGCRTAARHVGGRT